MRRNDQETAPFLPGSHQFPEASQLGQILE